MIKRLKNLLPKIIYKLIIFLPKDNPLSDTRVIEENNTP